MTFFYGVSALLLPPSEPATHPTWLCSEMATSALWMTNLCLETL